MKLKVKMKSEEVRVLFSVLAAIAAMSDALFFSFMRGPLILWWAGPRSPLGPPYPRHFAPTRQSRGMSRITFSLSPLWFTAYTSVTAFTPEACLQPPEGGAR